jgi:hypothetical protein
VSLLTPEQSREIEIKQVRARDYIAVSPYLVHGGIDSLTTIKSAAALVGGVFDGGEWNTPMYVRCIRHLSDEDIGLLLDLLKEATHDKPAKIKL